LFDHSQELLNIIKWCISKRKTFLGFRLLIHYAGFIRPLLLLSNNKQRTSYGYMIIDRFHLGTYLFGINKVRVSYDPVKKGFVLNTNKIGISGIQLDADYCLIQTSHTSAFLVKLHESRSLWINMGKGATRYGEGYLVLKNHWIPENSRIYYQPGEMDNEAMSLVRNIQNEIYKMIIKQFKINNEYILLSNPISESIEASMRSRVPVGFKLSRKILSLRIIFMNLIPKLLYQKMSDERVRSKLNFLGREDIDMTIFLHDIESVSELKHNIINIHKNRVTKLPIWIWIIEFITPLFIRFDLNKNLKNVYRNCLWLRYYNLNDTIKDNIVTATCKAWIE